MRLASGPTSCRVKGYAQNKVGQSECISCPRGTFTDSEGLLACEACGVRGFQDLGRQHAWVVLRSVNMISRIEGQGSCQECPTGSLSGFRGARNRTDCRCERGFYGAAGTACVECDPVSMFCPGTWFLCAAAMAVNPSRRWRGASSAATRLLADCLAPGCSL